MAAAAIATPATVTTTVQQCQQALDVLGGCPLIPSNWQTAGQLGSIVMSKTLPVCCAAATTFNQLKCARRQQFVQQLQSIMGGLSCDSVENGEYQL